VVCILRLYLSDNFVFQESMALTRRDLQEIRKVVKETLDERFGEYDKKMDKRFVENDKKWEELLDKKFSEYTTRLLELIPTKAELAEKIDEAKNELRDEFRERITSVQDAVVNFHNEWKFGVPPMVKSKLDEHDVAIGDLRKKVGLRENQMGRQ